jgi:hypothetical protein
LGARHGPTTTRLLAQLGIVGRTLSSAADAAGLGGIAGFRRQFPSRPLVYRSKRAPSRSKCWERIRTSLKLTFGLGESCPGLVHDKTIFICGYRLCRSGVPGLSAGCRSFCRYDRHRGHELRSLAVYERASSGGNRLDLWFLDRTHAIAPALDQAEGERLKRKLTICRGCN